jgi:putative ABC transport system permease protein
LPNFEDIRERNSVFSALVGYAPVQARVRAKDVSEGVRGEVVTGDYFQALGVLPSLGRVLSPDDDTEQADPVVVISRYFWQTSLASDQAIIGTTLFINGVAFTVAGVAEEGFQGTDSLFRADLWVALAKGTAIGRPMLDDRRADGLRVLGRLRREANLSQAQANLDVLTATLREEHPEENRGLRALVMWEKQSRPEVGFARQFSLALLFVMVTQVIGLVITGTNVTSLMLARAVSRQRELALRLALGATRSRLYGEILFESLFLAAAASVLGLIAARWTMDLLSQVRLPGMGSLYMDWRLDGTVFLFGMGLTFVTAAAVAVAPALVAIRTDPQRWLHGGHGSTGTSRVSRLRYRVVVSQFSTLAMTLMTAGVLTQSAGTYMKSDLGFETDNRLLFRLSMSELGYDAQRGRQLFETFLERIRALPGVIAADAAEDVRLTFDQMSMEIEPAERPEESPIDVSYNVVGRDYFKTMGIKLVQGREFNTFDNGNTTRVAIINEQLAGRFWPGQNPLGKRFAAQRGDRTTVFEVIGVEKTGKYYSLNEPAREFFYLPYMQEYRPTLAVHVHTQTDPRAMTPVVRQVLQEVAPGLATFDVSTQSDMIELSQFGPPRFAGSVMGLIGFIQFVIAAVGMYGLLSYLARLQTREIGIRMALGATRYGIVKFYTDRGARLAARGFIRGALVSLATLWLMRRFLPGFEGIASYDLTTILLVVGLLAGVTTAAAYLPTRRVLADNPMAALRHE